MKQKKIHRIINEISHTQFHNGNDTVNNGHNNSSTANVVAGFTSPLLKQPQIKVQ